MSDQRPSRRDLMRPVQLLGFAFAAAVFGGGVTLVSMGFFEDLGADERAHAVIVALIVAGVSFIATLVIIALLMLAVDPAQVTKSVDRPVLLHDEDEDAAGEASENDPGDAPRHG
ncbi:MAG: amino acid transporter [Microbacterium sp.]